MPPRERPVGDERIQHVFVLMLENRSFDHMLGYLDQGCLPPLSTSDGVLADPSDETSRFVPVEWHESYSDVTVDPGHGYDDVMRQLTGTNGVNGFWSSPYDPTNDGFVWNYATRRGSRGLPPVHVSEIMGCYPAERLPVMSTLAREFAVCSRWHCSLPSETWPNRLFVHAGTSFAALGFDKLVHDERTIFDLLDEGGLDSRVYAGDIAQVLTFGRGMIRRVRHMSRFDEDVSKGDVAAYTFIEPRHFDSPLGKANSQHPISQMHGIVSSGYVPRGEALLAQIFTALRSNPYVWDHTLLVVVYDEHGGFYDRLPPPKVDPTGDVASNGFPFDLLGPRVPSLVISPYVRAGVIEHSKTFDHTSLTATVRELFGIPSSLSAREDMAMTVTALLDRAAARGADELPDLEEYANEDWFPELEEVADRPLDDFQRQLLALASALDIEFEAEVTVTDETSSQAVGDQVARFVERNYPPMAIA